jgi:hypothetical protein
LLDGLELFTWASAAGPNVTVVGAGVTGPTWADVAVPSGGMPFEAVTTTRIISSSSAEVSW